MTKTSLQLSKHLKLLDPMDSYGLLSVLFTKMLQLEVIEAFLILI